MIVQRVREIFIGLAVALVLNACGGGSNNSPAAGSDSNNANTVTPGITDTTAPTINLMGDNPMIITVGDDFLDPGAEAIDETDGSVVVTSNSNVNTEQAGIYTIAYEASDAAGNSRRITREVRVMDPVVTEPSDITPPSIHLIGDNPLVIHVGEDFQDPGVEATDNVDDSMTVDSMDNVNNQLAGRYVITYTAVDSAGNISEQQRNVDVMPTGEVQVYSQPGGTPGLLRSDTYDVAIWQDNIRYTPFVYKSVNNHTQSIGTDQPERPLTTAERETKFKTDSNHWANFSFSGPITISVTLANETVLADTIEIRPLNKEIIATVENNTVSFQIEEAGHYYVKLSETPREPLFIFANPLPEPVPDINAANVFTGEQIKNTPELLDENSEQVIYFAPGVHTISEPVFNSNGLVNRTATEQDKFPDLPSNTTVYIAGGAFVKGFFRVQSSVENVHFKGRGIVSGFDYPHEAQTWENHMLEFTGHSANNISIEGLTFTDGPKTCIIARSGPIIINNVKCLGWHANTDGIASGQNSEIRNSFFKVFDDVVKLFHSGMRVENNVIWHQQTGSAFQLSWNLSNTINNIRVSDIDMIAVDRQVGSVLQTGGSAVDYPDGSRTNGGINNALINARNLNGANLSNIHFDNIRFDSQPFQLLQLQLKDHRGGFSSGAGNIDDIRLNNVDLPETPRVNNYILDNGVGRISNIVIDNIVVDDQTVSSSDLLLEEQTNTN